MCMKPDRATLARFQRQAKPQANGCLLWMGQQGADGYARWKPAPGAHTIYVHRWVYETFVGPIPPGMDVDHACHSRAVEQSECEGGAACLHRRCCNIAHLELVTRSENTKRQNHANRRKTTCPEGHPLDGENLVMWSDGRRRCRQCLRNRPSHRETPTQAS